MNGIDYDKIFKKCSYRAYKKAALILNSYLKNFPLFNINFARYNVIYI